MGGLEFSDGTKSWKSVGSDLQGEDLLRSSFENYITLPFDDIPSDLSEFFDLPPIDSRFNRYTQSMELIEGVSGKREYTEGQKTRKVHSIIYLIVDKFNNIHKIGRIDDTLPTRKANAINTAKKIRNNNEYRYKERYLDLEMGTYSKTRIPTDVDAINEIYDFGLEIGGKQYAQELIEDTLRWIPLEIVFIIPIYFSRKRAPRGRR